MIYYAALLFFVFDYVRPGNYIPGLDLLMLNAIVPLVAILGTAFGKTPVQNKEFFAEMNTKIMAVLLFLLVVSTMFATVHIYAYTVMKNVFAYMLIYWVLYRQIGDVKRLSGVFLTLTTVHLVIAALNPSLFTDPDSRVGINSGAFLGDGNDFSLSVNICLPLCLFLMLEAKKKIAKLGYMLAVLALVLGIVATKSRGGTVALGAVMLYFWLKSERKAMMAGLSVMLIAIVLVIAPPSYFARMNMITDTEEGSAQGRIHAWGDATQMALKSPLLGVGAGHFPMAYGGLNQGRWMTAHSIYFLLLGELGLPGLLVLLTMIFANLIANRRLLPEVRKLPKDQAATATNALACTSAALVAFATGGAFLSAAYYPHIYVLSGLMAASRRLVRHWVAVAERAGTEATALTPQLEPRRVRPGAISPDWRPKPAFDTGQLGRHSLLNHRR